MKVCMIAYTTYDHDARVRREAETLVAAGFQVTCLTPRAGDSPVEHRIEGVRVVELNVQKYRGKRIYRYIASYAFFLIRAFFACSRMTVAKELDILHVHNLPDVLVFAGLLPRILGRKLILDVHDSVPETYMSKFAQSKSLLYRALCFEEKLSAGLVHRVICVNHPQRDRLVGRGIPAGKIFVSMNVPDHRVFNPQTPLSRGSDNGFQLIYHGTMAKRLGVDLLIRAVAALRERIPALKLHLWGTGDDLDTFQRLVSELELKDMVFFKPQGVSFSSLPEQLAAMDLGIIGNRKDIATELMLPVKMMEYMAMGIPVVVPRLRAIEFYFSDDMVAFYEPENIEELANRILDLHKNANRRRFQVEAARRFLLEYGWNKQGVHLVEMYRSLTDN